MTASEIVQLQFAKNCALSTVSFSGTSRTNDTFV